MTIESTPGGLASTDGLGAGADAHTEWREAGHCTNCHAPVTLVHNSTHPTCREDGARYVDASRPDRGWCMFRCGHCHAVIEDKWAPNAELRGRPLADGPA